MMLSHTVRKTGRRIGRRDGRRVALLALVAAFGLAAGACADRSGDIEFKLPRTDAEIEAAARRGDSMVAMIAIGQAIADTLAKVASGELDASALAALAANAAQTQPVELPPTAASGSGERMSKRAQARGDSMAREAARRRSDELAEQSASRRADSLVGTVVVTDEASGARKVSLDSPMSRMPVALSGMPTSDMARLSGLEVAAFGVRVSPADLVVSRFVVRRQGDLPVDDGILVNEGGQWALELTEGGRRALDQVPGALRSHIGARVWIARSGADEPAGGVVRPL